MQFDHGMRGNTAEERKGMIYGEWDPPPLILEYSEDGIRVNDGRHRLEMYRQLGISKAWAVCWRTREKI